MRIKTHRGLVGFLLQKGIVRSQLQAHSMLIVTALLFYTISALLVFSYQTKVTDAQKVVAYYQSIDQSLFK